MIYLVPTFRNPSGETWSPERRRMVAEIAAEPAWSSSKTIPTASCATAATPVPAVKAFD